MGTAAAGGPWPRLAGVVVFAVAFALVEATVVVYLPEVFGPEQAVRSTAAHVHSPRAYLYREQARELATMVMLLSVGFVAGRTCWRRFAFWLLAFGVWDIFYYVLLWAYPRWPSSLSDRDLLFLIPQEWRDPVWMPVLVSCVFIAVAVVVLEYTRRA